MIQRVRTICSVFAISAMSVITASCAKEELSEEAQQSNPGVERTISASATLPPSQGDKAYLDVADGRKVKWELNDAVNINGTNLALTKVTSTDSTKAIFDGTTYAIHSGSQDIYWVVYPTSLAGAYDGNIPTNFTESQFTFTMPDAQTYDISQTKILEGSTYMAAKVSVPTGETHLVFSMKNLGAVMKIHLSSATGVSNTNVDRIVFSSSSRLNGEFYFDGRAVTASAADACNQLTINLTDGTNSYVDISGGVDVYAFLPPISGGRLSMTVINTDGREMTRTVSNVTLAQNTMYTSRFNVTAFSAPFSVSDCKKVLFSPGNLQWSATGGGTTATTHATADGLGGPGTWRFAEHQWEYVGYKPANNTYEQYRSTSTGWIDLFGWATSGYHDVNDPNNIMRYPYSAIDIYYSYDQTYYDTVYGAYPDATYNYYGYGPSINMTDPSLVGTSANYDWGVYNAIYNPQTGNTDPAGTWRSLTSLEWKYLASTREKGGSANGTANPRFTMATINTDATAVKGLILFPDGYTDNGSAPAGVTWGAINAASAYATQCTSAGWAALEAAGCAFLPAAGNRYAHFWFVGVGTEGNYWFSTAGNNRRAGGMGFYSNFVITTTATAEREKGNSVRLVKDVN